MEEKTGIVPFKKEKCTSNEILEVEMNICESEVKEIEKLTQKMSCNYKHICRNSMGSTFTTVQWN